MAASKTHGVTPVWAILWTVSLAVILFTAAVYAQSHSREEARWKGREVFRSKGCIHCHSIFGQNDKDGPDLGREKYYGTYLELAARMWNHFPDMFKKMQKSDIEFREINSDEMGQIISYISFARYVGEPGNEYKGQQLLKKSCMKCHMFDGVGGDIGPDITGEYLSSVQLVEAMWNHGPDMLDVFEEHDIKRPVFKGNDINHILAALRSYARGSSVPPVEMGDPEKGKVLFDEKGCVQCHSFYGVGGTLGPDFGDKDLKYTAVEIAGRMWNHGPKMWEIMERENIDFPSFEKGEMADVIAYLYERKMEDAPGDSENGGRIIKHRGCLSCHSLNGQGGTVSEDLATVEGFDNLLAMIAAMWNHAPAMREKQLEEKLKWPKLKARDMADLYAYLHETTAPPVQGKTGQ